MHIITGLLISAFLGRKKDKDDSVGTGFPGFRYVLEIRHAIPGRMRLYAPVLKENNELGESLVRDLGKADGINSIDTSPITGTALISYNSQKVEAQIVFGAVVRLLGLEKDIEKTPESRVSKGIQSMSDSVNRALYEKSSGLVDLHTLLPVVLAGFGIYKITRPGGLNAPGGITLLWWAYMQLLAEKKEK
ncbi:MAG: hypothetical protein HN368_06400 [Spirochaetales bacterium]|jgi:hypothetical protein|nr:hypothetical protein [Spirochaetales bacterium]